MYNGDEIDKIPFILFRLIGQILVIEMRWAVNCIQKPAHVL